jgi:predicted DNA binding protein
MWTLKLLVPGDENSLLGDLARKNDVSLFGYPVSAFINELFVDLTISGFMCGMKDNINSFIGDLKKDKRTIMIESNDSHIILRIQQSLVNKDLFMPGIIHLKPAFVNKDGNYVFEIAAWKREDLVAIAKSYEPYGGIIEKIKQKKTYNVQLISIGKVLSDQQHNCLQKAISKGYYDYPRNISLNELAKEMNISYSTFQYHLRLAEKKVMPSVLVNI